jgi:hypothetical protein
MGKSKSKSKIEPKSERSERPLINQPTRMKAINNIPQTTQTPTSWLEYKTIDFDSFKKQTAEQQQQQEIANQEEISRKQKRIKPLLVKYLQYYLKDPRYKIYPYVMGNVFGNLPDGYYPNMLYLCGYKRYNNEMEYIEIPIDIDALDSDGDDGIQEIRYNVPPNLINKVKKLQKSFNTTNKLDFSRANGGKNNKKQQSKSMRSRASTKSHKHHRKSFTLKNVK